MLLLWFNLTRETSPLSLLLGHVPYLCPCLMTGVVLLSLIPPATWRLNMPSCGPRLNARRPVWPNTTESLWGKSTWAVRLCWSLAWLRSPWVLSRKAGKVMHNRLFMVSACNMPGTFVSCVAFSPCVVSWVRAPCLLMLKWTVMKRGKPSDMLQGFLVDLQFGGVNMDLNHRLMFRYLTFALPWILPRASLKVSSNLSISMNVNLQAPDTSLLPSAGLTTWHTFFRTAKMTHCHKRTPCWIGLRWGWRKFVLMTCHWSWLNRLLSCLMYLLWLMVKSWM